MRFQSNNIPENVRRLMPKEPVRELPADFIPSKNAAESEKELQKQLANLLSLRGYFWLGSAFGRKSTCKAGTPDFQFTIKSQTVYWEVKAMGGRLSDDQRFVHEQVRKNGALVFIIQSYDEALSVLNVLEAEG